MKMKPVLLALLVGSLNCIAHAQDQLLGQCDSGSSREKRHIEIIADSQNDAGTSWTAKQPCTNKTFAIARCAVLSVRNINAPRSCFGTGRPDYSEDVGIVEYWESPEAKPVPK